MKSRKKLTVAFSVILCVCLVALAMLVSFAKFDSVNLPKIIYAVAAVSSGNEDYVVIRGNTKKVIIADPNDPDSFYKYLEANGYVELEEERMGSMRAIEKDGVTEYVDVTGNGYYRLWIWQK